MFFVLAEKFGISNVRAESPDTCIVRYDGRDYDVVWSCARECYDVGDYYWCDNVDDVVDAIRFDAELRRYVDVDAVQACGDEIRTRINWYGNADICIIGRDGDAYAADVYTRNLEKIASFSSDDPRDMLRQLGEYIGWRRNGDDVEYLYHGEWYRVGDGEVKHA